MIKAVLSDFDGTLVLRDILDVACEIVGKGEESERLNREFQAGQRPGLPTLIQRINFLKGVSFGQIKKKLEEDPFLMSGAHDWVRCLRDKGIYTILYSGNIEPILKFYQERLGIDFIVGTKPRMVGEVIAGINEEDFPAGNWKLVGIQKILKKLKIKSEETLVIGDSPADKPIFQFAGKSLAIDPKNGIEKEADFVIRGDLRLAIPFLESLLN